MKINYVEHIAINTLDIDESIHFYRDILGFELENTVDFGEESLVYIRVNKDTRMELCDLRGRSKEKQPYNTLDGGFRHLAFDVDDLETWEKYLEEKGVRFELHLTDLPTLGKKAILVYDPNGTIVELCCDR